MILQLSGSAQVHFKMNSYIKLIYTFHKVKGRVLCLKVYGPRGPFLKFSLLAFCCKNIFAILYCCCPKHTLSETNIVFLHSQLHCTLQSGFPTLNSKQLTGLRVVILRTLNHLIRNCTFYKVCCFYCRLATTSMPIQVMSWLYLIKC